MQIIKHCRKFPLCLLPGAKFSTNNDKIINENEMIKNSCDQKEKEEKRGKNQISRFAHRMKKSNLVVKNRNENCLSERFSIKSFGIKPPSNNSKVLLDLTSIFYF